ncbi:4-hydroxy-tetrahydrodipicolinate reductase [Clostridium magnum]|uniref:4-hydroxy-tetrahydrodipicolinate reductase n=1 Tax=Clostridium magnum DSM 2767 TaxID=1121326 RepID=A0A162SM60_9CLOT|nr:4-hydroxy-tetrahydrodipicolinate reductase [Clostridium magnum]KZL91601.1 4-hydroxy-tetrahydrodipicolinate reductase [Clostridium magnum DSM 2767]SHH49121.1 dihydrodipicolinate reductase [Clostridium magnum DSM 2767]
MLKLIINGCNGAMGQTLTKIIGEMEDAEIVAGIDQNPERCKNSYPVYTNILDSKEEADAVIDFSNPGSLPGLLQYGTKTSTALVIATTGLSAEDLGKIKEASEKIAIFQSGNTSLGINLLTNLVRKAAAVLNETFDIEIIEKHHNKKIDAPSGTAYMLANEINDELNNSKEFVYGREGQVGKRTKKEIGIHAVRGGTIVGEHTAIFAGLDEVIEIKHTATSKAVFAQGAIKAAKFIAKQDKGLYNMKDVLKLD